MARSRLVVLLCCYGLMLNFFVMSVAALNGVVIATFVIWLIQVLPLLIFLPGLHQNRLRSYAWFSFVILLYFMHGVLVAFDPARRIPGLIEVGLCVVVFVYLILYIRQYRQHYGTGLQ